MQNRVSSRRVDELGRIVLPIEYRKKLDINEGDPLDIEITEDSMILKKLKHRCITCFSEENLVNFKEKMFCENCIKELEKLSK